MTSRELIRGNTGKLKGAYIISETACLRPGSGANMHIQAGLEEMGKYFDLLQVLFCAPYQAPATAEKKNGAEMPKASSPSIKKKLKAFFKWPLLLLKNHVRIVSHYKKIRRARPQFIYERASYLNYNGLIIAKLLKIPHFYEVNGISSFDNRKYYPGIWNAVAEWLERTTCNKSTLGFYIGGIHHELGVNKNKACTVQNGIEKEFIEKFENRTIGIPNVIHLAFIGHVMDHHRLDVLTDAMHFLTNRTTLHLHLIGTGMETLKDQFPSDLPVTWHGLLNHQQICNLLPQLHIGMVLFAYDYTSSVKSFLYGAGKLLTIVPEKRNFLDVFFRDEAVYVKNADARDLADKLEYIREQPLLIQEYGEKIYKKVATSYTWETIFRNKAQAIMNEMEKQNLIPASQKYNQ